MAVEDVIKLVKKVATEVIPDTITFTDVKVEASNVVLYTPNLEIFSDNNDLIRKLAQNVRKRIVIKADSSVRKPIISAKQKLKEIMPDEAGVVDTRFDEINGDVILEATNPGRAIGKHGVVLNQIRREIGWNPVVIRSSPMESRTLKDIRKCVTSDLKEKGSIWLVGKNKKQMGASLYYRTMGIECPNVPTTDFDSFIPRMEQLIDAIECGEVVACHDISTGGIALSVIEMCMSGVGAKIKLSGNMRADLELFNESNGRWIVQVKPGLEEKFSKRFDYAKEIGTVNDKINFALNDNENIEFPIEELRKLWTEPLWNKLA